MLYAITGKHPRNQITATNDRGEIVCYTPTTLLLETTDPKNAKIMVEEARREGFYEITISKDDGTPPDFISAIQV